MSALLKVYTDVGHTSEVAHTTQNSTTSVGSQAIGTSAFNVVSTASMPAQGIIDIIDGVNGNETIAYTAVASSTQLTLAKATAFLHTGGQVVNQWYYGLSVGDQVNGILNDGTQVTPTGLNTQTWYAYNAGDQTALNITLSVSSVIPPATADGVADTLVSITGSGAGFATSVSPANLAVGAVQQFWVCEEVPLGQGNTPGAQVGVATLLYQSI
jgi:hypothetical protein